MGLIRAVFFHATKHQQGLTFDDAVGLASAELFSLTVLANSFQMLETTGSRVDSGAATCSALRAKERKCAEELIGTRLSAPNNVSASSPFISGTVMECSRLAMSLCRSR